MNPTLFDGANLWFLLTFLAASAVLLTWAFKRLPREHWQIVAAVPLRRGADGLWSGLNLTYYGLFVAAANVAATALFLCLAGSVGMSAGQVVLLAAGTFAVSLPAASLVARIVERKKNTFTVSGASFAGFVAFPLIVALVSRFQPLGWAPIDLMAAFAALATSYALGEGLGRLACISFGCCYGRPLTHCHPMVRKLFTRLHFVFHGETKKIAYEKGLHGHPVVPVQALTALVCTGAAFVGSALFLAGAYGAAFFLSVAVTQLWRLGSEVLRADHRGLHRVSAYQVFSGITVVYAGALWWWFRAEAPIASPNIAAGVNTLWAPGVILFLQLLGATVFLYMGRSKVTAATLSFRVLTDQV